jgi:hypothetical protein
VTNGTTIDPRAKAGAGERDTVSRRGWRKVWEGCLAVSLANLAFVTAWFSLLYDADRGYFNKLPVTNSSLLALLANLAWLGVLVWFLIQGMLRARSRIVRVGCRLAFILVLVLPLDFCRREFLHVGDAQLLAFLRRPTVLLGVLLGTAGLAWQHRRAARAAMALVAVSVPLALVNLGRVLLLLLGLTQIAQHAGVPLMEVPRLKPAVGPRVVWIIFDETDQRLTFEKRPHNLGLTSFDELRAGALYATNAYPPADETLRSLPSLTLGRRVATASFANASDLALTFAEGGAATSWGKERSVFDAARALGVNTALVGWYHPYARVLGHGLNHCEWYPYPAFEPAQGSSFGESMKRQIYCLALNLHVRRLFADICRATLEDSVSVATNQLYSLVFLHLPPPHKPGVFLPESGRFTVFSFSKVAGYFNNLALADRSLATLRSAISSSGAATNTWLILSADHSWRESRLYDGRRDLRVPFVVRAPQDHRPLTYSSKLNTVMTHDMVLAILRGDVTNHATLAAWLDLHRRNEPTILGSSGPED